MPPTYLPTTPDIGIDSADSDINPATGRTANFVLTAGQVDLTRDAGLLRLGGISGQVREDLDSDGDLGDADPPIGSVTIRLFPDANCDQIADGPKAGTANWRREKSCAIAIHLPKVSRCQDTSRGALLGV